MKRILFLFLLGLTFTVYSQSVHIDVISSSGATFNTNDVCLSFTVGEAVVETFSTSDLVLNQGFHQPTYLFTDVTKVDNRVHKISLFPNPATDYINVRCETEGFMYRFIDMGGRVIFDGHLNRTLTRLSLDNICEQEFFLEVYSTRNKSKKTFKVIKQ